MLALILCIACGDDVSVIDASAADSALPDSGPQSDAGADATSADSAVADASLNDAGPSGADVADPDSGITDAGLEDVQPDVFDAAPVVDDTIYFEVLAEFSAEEWVRGVALTHPITTSALLDVVELRALRDFDGYIEVRERGEPHLLGGGPERAFRASSSFPAGEYELFVTYFGTVTPDAPTAHFTAVVATPPRPATSYAIVVGAAAEVIDLLPSGNYNESRFTVRPGHRYVAHGVAGLSTTLILNEDDVALILAGDSVTPLHRWGGTGDGLSPAPMYLDLAPGNYSLFAFNDDSQSVASWFRWTNGSCASLLLGN